ncbi:PTS mannitol transporter subunit IICB [Sediminibacillus albus]|uniref:PTS system mannitol-specific EIICB component n=1 Tax=Sediminibacillus albus TaxID=407036 RepID=A0A1G8WST8_9BACI|nr:PTS mannitol transporter subunit IICB [Sediminibacillus albus]SDJ81472.1 PTS system, mannitol-specific IIC component [Sediminibacillus albus]
MADKGFRAKVQRFGSYLSGMVMPNIAAFIAWGIITALFIPDGWIPNEDLAQLVGPMINYLLPLLIGFTGGRLVYDLRGGVVGATATMGMIVGAEIPMFLGAMIMGPLGGYLIKKIDQVFQDKIKSGFEMLYNNFSAGILGAVVAGLAVKFVGPVVQGLQDALAAGVEVIVNAGLLPLTSIIIEPAKILFLNNAINHGILSPLGVEQAANAGKSILFLLETNPGPGLGILLAFAVFGTGTSKSSASGAALIHFVGGIHEIYFPYVLMKPTLILAAIGGGASGVLTFSIFNAGLSATPSPGSIIALLALAPNGNHIPVILGVVVATVVSFLIASLILKSSKSGEGEDLNAAAGKMEEMKGKKSSVAGQLNKQEGQAIDEAQPQDTGEQDNTALPEEEPENINKVVFACDAGMGSSAMGASLLKDKFKKAGIDVFVTNTAINQLPDDADIVITHKDLTDRAKQKLPGAHHISVDNFLNSPKYTELVERLKK